MAKSKIVKVNEKIADVVIGGLAAIRKLRMA